MKIKYYKIQVLQEDEWHKADSQHIRGLMGFSPLKFNRPSKVFNLLPDRCQAKRLEKSMISVSRRITAVSN